MASIKRHNKAGNETVTSVSKKPEDPPGALSLASKLRKRIDEAAVADIEDWCPPAVRDLCTRGPPEAAVADIEDWCPPRWPEVLENIRTMRVGRNAPVDSMGAEVFMTDPGSTDPKAGRLFVLVSLMLSSQTRDEVNHAAMTRLRQAGLSLTWLKTVPEPQLAETIKPVGFWRRKAQYLKAAAALLETDYDGDIPPSVGGLCKLPGVGPKMAHLTMNIAWRQLSGIGVDTHVHRISNRLGWVRRPTKTPEQTRLALEAWLPKEHWAEINLLLVGLGQQVCTPVAPRCGNCRNYSLCPAATTGSPTKKPRR